VKRENNILFIRRRETRLSSGEATPGDRPIDRPTDRPTDRPVAERERVDGVAMSPAKRYTAAEKRDAGDERGDAGTTGCALYTFAYRARARVREMRMRVKSKLLSFLPASPASPADTFA